MKSILCCFVMCCSVMFAQEQTGSEWKIMPSIIVTKLFSVGNRNSYSEIQPLTYPPMGRFGSAKNSGFSTTGVSFSARFLNTQFEPFAFTLSAGANWYRSRNSDRPVPMPGGIGYPFPIPDTARAPIPDYRSIRGGSNGIDNRGFMSFPVSIGVQAVFPYEKMNKLMFFAGIEGNLHFMSERVVARRQVEAGFSALGGVAIRMFEFGVRYSRFSGINNVGVQAGIRFNQFEL